MKKIITVLFLAVIMLLTGATAYCGTKSLTFGWQQTATDLPQMKEWTLYQADAVAGPWIVFTKVSYDGTPKTEYTSTQPLTVPDSTEKTIYFCVSASDKSGNESGKSNVVSAVIDFLAPAIPVTLQVTVTN
jgi:hypothetical protein